MAEAAALTSTRCWWACPPWHRRVCAIFLARSSVLNVRVHSKLKFEFELVCSVRSFRLRTPSAQAPLRSRVRARVRVRVRVRVRLRLRLRRHAPPPARERLLTTCARLALTYLLPTTHCLLLAALLPTSGTPPAGPRSVGHLHLGRVDAAQAPQRAAGRRRSAAARSGASRRAEGRQLPPARRGGGRGIGRAARAACGGSGPPARQPPRGRGWVALYRRAQGPHAPQKSKAAGWGAARHRRRRPRHARIVLQLRRLGREGQATFVQ